MDGSWIEEEGKDLKNVGLFKNSFKRIFLTYIFIRLKSHRIKVINEHLEYDH